MPFTLATFETQLTAALNLFDKKAAAALCDEFIEQLYRSSDLIPPESRERILQRLRNKRMFTLIQQVADCFMQLGLHTSKIRRQYAQSLIDQGVYAAAMAILERLMADTKMNDPAEHAEATGLIGRIYKQQYVNAGLPQDRRIAGLLLLAIKHYQQVYDRDPENYRWHGINLVALLFRAQRDHLPVPGPNPLPIAAHILDSIATLDKQGKAEAWDLATALEACIALNRQAEALSWTDKYIRSSADAFEIGSTLRQFREVWQLDMTTAMGQQVICLLNAALLKRECATLTITPGELRQQLSPDQLYTDTLKEELHPDSFQTYEWYLKGLRACSAVARIGENTLYGFGTGFLLDGGRLSTDLNGKLVLLTNAHVVSDDPNSNNGSLKAGRAVATLETAAKDLEIRFTKINRTSSIDHLDTTILEIDDALQEKLKTLDILAYAIAQNPPDTSGSQRVFIIGHPRGGMLRISIQDNIFLACNDRLMQYRTPTEHGSSGSPVFNENWELIGIHHAGGPDTPRLDDPRTTYEANEGIWIGAIQKLFAAGSV